MFLFLLPFCLASEFEDETEIWVDWKSNQINLDGPDPLSVLRTFDLSAKRVELHALLPTEEFSLHTLVDEVMDVTETISKLETVPDDLLGVLDEKVVEILVSIRPKRASLVLFDVTLVQLAQSFLLRKHLESRSGLVHSFLAELALFPKEFSGGSHFLGFLEQLLAENPRVQFVNRVGYGYHVLVFMDLDAEVTFNGKLVVLRDLMPVVPVSAEPWEDVLKMIPAHYNIDALKQQPWSKTFFDTLLEDSPQFLVVCEITRFLSLVEAFDPGFAHANVNAALSEYNISDLMESLSAHRHIR